MKTKNQPMKTYIKNLFTRLGVASMRSRVLPALIAGLGLIPAGRVTAQPFSHPQPRSQTVNAGQNVSFTVMATGVPPLSYQWRKGGVNVTGATSDSLTLINVQTSQAGNYTVVITNAYGSVTGSVTSSVAVLTVNRSGQTISFGVLPATLVSADPFSLSATASSGLPVSYSSSDPGVATVSSNTVTIKGIGSTTI